MSWFEKLLPTRIRTETSNKKSIPEGLWVKCGGCQAVLYRAELERHRDVCPKCDHHHRIGARRRLDIFLDKDGREEIGAELEPIDILKFKDSKKYKIVIHCNYFQIVFFSYIKLICIIKVQSSKFKVQSSKNFREFK